MFVSQSFPVNPIGQVHVNDATLSLHVAPFKQGLESHSFTSTLQILPINTNILINLFSKYYFILYLYNILLN